MKLRNKKTGEKVDLLEIVRLNDISDKFYLRLFDNEGRTFKVGFNSLTELNDGWEDYEEPKGFWSISADATIEHYDRLNENDRCKEIGNYFETREEAEKAVKKLKAWKRLNNCGLKFIDWWLSKDNHIIIGTNRQIFDIDEQGLREDLDLLFGGEE